MSLETAHLSLKPCFPAHILSLIEQPQRFEQVAGFPAGAGLREMFTSDEVSPNSAGVVEIAYGIAPSFERPGCATQAAGALAAFAFVTPLVELVRAHTLPEANALTRVPATCGFHHVGTVVDPDDGPVWRWERRR